MKNTCIAEQNSMNLPCTSPWEIVASVYHRFRGLPVKLAAMTGKTHQWWSSHAYEPRSMNPLSSGNVSEVEHYMRYCRKFEGSARGAGKYLNDRVHYELSLEFADEDHGTHDAEMQCEILDETNDVHKWLARHDIENATLTQHRDFQADCDEAITATLAAKSASRAQQLRITIARGARETAKETVAAKRGK